MEVASNVRVVAASNRDLEAAVAQGRFREDLYFRLNVIRVDMPPLRARGTDVLLLAQHFIERCAARAGNPIARLSPEAAKRLLIHGWPGNVRELQNCIEHALALAGGDVITVNDLPEAIRSCHPAQRAAVAGESDVDQLASLEDVERRHVLRVLEAVAGNRTLAADILGLDRKTLYRKLVRYSASG